MQPASGAHRQRRSLIVGEHLSLRLLGAKIGLPAIDQPLRMGTFFGEIRRQVLAVRQLPEQTAQDAVDESGGAAFSRATRQIHRIVDDRSRWDA